MPTKTKSSIIRLLIVDDHVLFRRGLTALLASRAELDELRVKVLADPRAWIAQPVISLSTVPTLVDTGIRPRHVDLRPFAVNDGDDVWVLPGGLTRVALPEGELIVNSSRGGGSKDTWVLAGPTDESMETPTAVAAQRQGSSAIQQHFADEIAAQQQQQQQQQQQARAAPC